MASEASGDFCFEKKKKNSNWMKNILYLSDEILGNKNKVILS